MIEFLDPSAEPAAAARSYTLGLGDAIHERPITIGLLANGFADSEAFLAEVRSALAERLPLAEFIAASKPNPSVLVSEDVFADLVARCDAIVTAYGH